ncbi:MAG: transglutaminase domain-containing protein [Candidatus Micrarchaeota archaeon]|nr:transglutaminase domain-containing protein [Candidatus Micrarchaeota archaeon]
MRPALAILLILLAIAVISGQAIQNPVTIRSATISIDENGTISISKGEFRSIEINLSIPSSTPYQKVQVNDKVNTDAEGNQFITISSKSPTNPFVYSKRMLVETSARTTKSLPSNYVVDSHLLKYLVATNRTQSGKAEIRQIAEEITANSSDPFEKVARLAIFVNGYVQYNKGMVGQEKDALWVLKNKQGVCTEYSTLFAALARAAGIPTRYVVGYAYDNEQNSWVGHLWNEAYIGEWVPVDSTWMEVGWLDAMHIEVSKGRELSDESNLVAYVTRQDGVLEWETSAKSGAYADNIYLLDAKPGTPIDDFEIKAVKGKLAPGEETIIFLSMKGEDYRVVSATLHSCVGDELKVASPKKQFLIMRPAATSVAVWEVKASPNVSKNYIYTCPLVISSPYFDERRVEVQIDPQLSESPSFQAALSQENIVLGQKANITLSLPYSRIGENFYIISESGVSSKQATAPAFSLSFSPAGPGKRAVYVAGEKGGFKKLTYFGSFSPGKIRIDKFEMPSGAVAGVKSKAVLSVSSANYPSDISVRFSFGGIEEEKKARINAKTEFEFEFLPEKTGSFEASASVKSSDGSEDSRKQFVYIEAQPRLLIVKKSIKKTSDGRLQVVFSFKPAGNLVSPEIKIGGISQPADKEATFVLTKGVYLAQLSWKDQFGNSYLQEEEIEVSEPLFPQVFEEPGSTAPSLCATSLAVALLLVAVAIPRR